MSAIAQPLLWCCLQVTLLAVAALVLNGLFARRRPAAGAVVAASALFAVVGLTAMALSPWPSWRSSWEHVFRRQAATVDSARAGDATLNPAFKLATVRPTVTFDDLSESEPASPRPVSESFLQRLSVVMAKNGLLLLAVLYLVGLGAMAARIGWGLAAVRGYRRDSLPLADRRLLELVDVVRAQLGCQRAIEVRESAQSSTPATIGWRRPVFLLPADWPTWTDEECLAVLAHEIEHVRRGDFAAWVAAQFGLALHFYHPLVHWLAARLRLQQELAADAAAARVLGGQRKYVTTLAAMALRQSDAAVAWPARAFLPTSKTFLRRIEMLHRSKSLREDVSQPLFYLSIAAVAAIALCAAGLRGSAVGDDRQNAAAPPASGAAAKPALPPAQLAEASKKNLRQLSLAMHNYHDLYHYFPRAVVIGPDGKTPHSWRVELLPFLENGSLYHEYRMNEPWDSPANKKVLDKMPDVFRSPFDDPKSTKSGYYVFTGPGTVFEGRKAIAFTDIADGTSNTLLVVEAKQEVPWTKPEDIPFDPTRPPSSVHGFVEGQFFAALADGSRRTIQNDKVKDQLVWLILRNDGHPIFWDEIAQTPRRAGRQPGENVGSPERFMVAVPGPGGNRAVHDKNNLKMLALAAHNYYDVFGHFPSAVAIGPDGKTPRSWRVELLPFVNGGSRLYGEYRRDEPWDSPANKKILEQMPDVFRSPYDDPKSLNSGYYALSGPDTAFGARFREITDGTSNTILIVTAKRDIPWTKPDDIPFDPAKPVPTLGGFVPGEFTAAMCDGSVHRFKTDNAKDQLKSLILRNDGQRIFWEKITPTAQSANPGSAGPFAAPAEMRAERNRAVHDKNNLKMLGLAMHNYHDVHRRFPTAVIIGPDGKTPHSWRVELLPYVSDGALYRKYRMDEPWDSPANKQILEQMPDVFRSPYDDPKSLNSGYYFLAGPDTAAGATLREITDGLSNTFLFVTAKRNIPWTKPEDIPFDSTQPVPTLGGFVPGEFAAAMCDGSAHRFQIDRVQSQLKWLIMRNDGKPIPIEVFDTVSR